MISLDNRSLLLWRRGRQDVALPTNAKNHLRGDGNLSPVKDATVRRECSTSIPRVEVVESRNFGCTDAQVTQI
jgi:hypothetical protein